MESSTADCAERKNVGFTLIELMVVIAIVSILAAIAIPSYAEYTKRARRADATTTLLRAVSRAERFFLNTNSYPTEASPGATSLAAMGIATTSVNGYYNIRYAYNGGAITATNPLFQAVAITGAAQSTDLDCRTFQVGMTGLRSVLSSTNVNNTATCWPGN